MVALTRDEVATELGFDAPWQVERLFCRQITFRTQGNGDDSGLDRTDIRQLLKDRHTEPPREFGRWVDLRHLQTRAKKFQTDVRNYLRKQIPERDPGEDQEFGYSKTIREAGELRPKPIPGAFSKGVSLPFNRQIQCYAAVGFDEQVKKEALRASGSLQRGEGASAIERLYASPERHQAILSAAWKKWQQQSIEVRQEFRDSRGKTVVRRFTLRHNMIPVDLATIARGIY